MANPNDDDEPPVNARHLNDDDDHDLLAKRTSKGLPPVAPQPQLIQPSTPATPAAAIVNTTGNLTMGNTAINQPQIPQQTVPVQAQTNVTLPQNNTEEKVPEEQSNKENEHWMKAYWRPAMGWLYMLICFMDFVGFPAVSMFLPVLFKGLGVQYAYVPWASLTLSNGGLIHMAFGAILGVAAWTRGQEKLAKIN